MYRSSCTFYVKAQRDLLGRIFLATRAALGDEGAIDEINKTFKPEVPPWGEIADGEE